VAQQKIFNKVQFIDANNGWAVGDTAQLLNNKCGATWWIKLAGHNNLLAVMF